MDDHDGFDHGAPVVVADDGTGAHLLAWWSTASLAPLEALIADGVASYRAALDRLGARHVAVAPAAVRNVNHPVDLGPDG